MSYKMLINKNGISSARFVCDTCGQEIETFEECAVTFDDVPFGSCSSVSHVHKGPCDDQNKRCMWHELGTDIIWILMNYGFLSKSGEPTELMKKSIQRAIRVQNI